jgi:cytochrome c oxidase cbb3-type subunit I/II
MLEDPLHLADLPTRLRALRTLGVPYTDDEIANAVVLAEAQARTIAEEVATQGGPANLHDREIVAVVAYLQRLGTDLKAAAPAQAAVLR